MLAYFFRLLTSFTRHEGAVMLALSPDDRTLVTGTKTCAIALVWNAHSGAKLLALRHRGGIRTEIFSEEDSQVVVTGCNDALVRL